MKGEHIVEKKYSARVISGIYTGMEGYIFGNKPNLYGNVMFYNIKESFPHRVCKRFEEIEILGEKKE